jgi:CheY-like chemotaxis protein
MIAMCYHDPMRELNVLSVEDEPSNGEIIQIILSSQGHHVTTVENGQEALDVLIDQGRAFDVVLMDIQMPLVDGLEATRRLRAHHATSQIAIICVSARASGSDGQAGLDAGCDSYITKPYKSRELLTVLRDTLIKRGVIGPDEVITKD